MTPWLIFFIVILFYNERKLPPMKNLAKILTLEVQILWKISAFQYYRWKYRNGEK